MFARSLFGVSRVSFSSRRCISWASAHPDQLSAKSPAKLYNLVGGKWMDTKSQHEIVDPLNGEVFIKSPNTQKDELEPFIESMNKCPKSGLHNMMKNTEKYVMWGEVTSRMADEMTKPEVMEYFTKAIQRVCPKSWDQAYGEVKVTRDFLRNFCGDNVRYLARGFSVAGDRVGQQSNGYRWPFGPVAIIAPFNFPLEIPVLQLMGAVYMGNKPVIKPAEKVAFVMEQWMRFMHHCGAPLDAIDMLHCEGAIANELLHRAPIRMTQFTGSSRVAELLSRELHGKVKIEDAGFDWKILGPDVPDDGAIRTSVAWQCDQDAYAATGQKCSAQSMMFAHKNWVNIGLLDQMKERASTRSLANLTVGPVLTQTTAHMLEHTQKLLQIPGARLLFGGRELANHSIPKCYGAIEPTAVFVPLEQLLLEEHFDTVTTEIFGPFQVVTEYDDSQIDKVLEACERMSHHLTAAVVSNDALFVNRVLGSTVNGTTYAGWLARTTGAPQNHWFGPCGDPRGAGMPSAHQGSNNMLLQGIGTKEAIQLVWSGHREIIMDSGPAASNLPKQS